MLKKLVNLGDGYRGVCCSIFANHFFCRVAKFKIKIQEDGKASKTRKKYLQDTSMKKECYQKNLLKPNNKKTKNGPKTRTMASDTDSK